MNSSDSPHGVRELVNDLVFAGFDPKRVLSPESLRRLCARAAEALKAAEARAQATEGVMAWRPIESAPRDGTDILLWAPHWRYPATGWTFGDDAWQGCRKDTHQKPPTHWMPLPEPPSAIQQSEGAK